MKNNFILIFVYIISFISIAQIDSLSNSDSLKINKIEDFILEKQLDSALYHIDKIEDSSDYLKLLKDLADNRNIDYKSYDRFVTNVSNRGVINYLVISSFIDGKILVPEHLDFINQDYVTIKINQISRLREDGYLDKASQINKGLTTYIGQFDIKNKAVIRAKTRASAHEIVMFLIQGDIQKGKSLIQENLKIAEKINDKNLTMMSLYYLSDFLLVEGKLQEYIDVNEQNLKLEKEVGEESEFHIGILINLTDAYIYKGGHNRRVQELLGELYDNPISRTDCYSLYAKYLSHLPKNSTAKTEVFEKFNVSNIKEFAELAKQNTKGVLNLNEYNFVLEECTNALEKNGYLKEALGFQRESVSITRKVYSEDLSKSLASFQTEQAVKIKDIEIESEKKRSRILIIGSCIVGLLLLLSLYFLIKSRQKSIALKNKNKIIDEQLKEKELLVKEVHHRVKNNFQIVSSLLELQSKGIEDQKARAMADDGKNRVRSMAIIHQKLYQNDTGLVDFDLYIRELVDEISNLYKTETDVETNLEVNNVKFDIDTAIPLGLILNEVITNSYKYAFAKAESPQLNISLVQNEEDFTLNIKDNGVGIGSEFDINKSKSLGLRLVKRLTKQLQGKVAIIVNTGTEFQINFKNTLQRQLID